MINRIDSKRVPAPSAAQTQTFANKLRRNVSLSALLMATALCAAAPNAAFALNLTATSGQSKTTTVGPYDDSLHGTAVWANGGTITIDSILGTTINLSNGSWGGLPGQVTQGIGADPGGIVNIDGVTTINITHTGSRGLYANGGGTINMNADVMITGNANGTVIGGITGIYVVSGGHFNEAAGARLTIDLQAGTTGGIEISQAGSTMDLAGGADISSSGLELYTNGTPGGTYGTGIFVQTGGSLTGNDVNITMAPATPTDTRPTALSVQVNSTVTLTGGTITSASTGNGVEVATGSTVTLTGTTIKVLNDSANGTPDYANGSSSNNAGRGRGATMLGGTLTLDHVTLTTNTTGPVNAFAIYQGDGYGVAVSDTYWRVSGVYTQFDAVANIKNGTSITTSGDNAAGLYVTNYFATTGYGAASATSAVANVTGSVIKTSGAGAFGVSVKGGTANVDVTSTITTTGAGAIGVNVAGVPYIAAANVAGTSIANIAGTPVTTSGANAHGVNVTGGTANVTNPGNATLISTSGDGAIGVRVAGTSAITAIANVDASNVTTSGANAHGLSVTGGTANITNASSLYTTGAGAFGVNVAGSSATIAIANIDHSNVTTTNANTYGLNITGGTANFSNNANILTLGDGSTGVRLAGANATRAIANIAGSNVSVNGDNARGVDVEGGTANLTAGTKITTVGANADGLYASSTNAIINADASRVTTSGANSPGLHAVDGGKIVFANNNVITGDASSAGIVTSGATGGSIVEVTNATINTPSDAIQTTGGAGTIAFTGVTTTPGSGVLLNAQATSTTFSADSSMLTGSMILGTGTSAVTLTNGTMWNMTDNSVATDLTNDNSTIAFSAPTGDPTLLASYKTLSVNSYTGNNGTIRLNTWLGGDGSPSDRLVVNGTATGSTLLDIRSTGGAGATTTDGIIVVQSLNNATTNTGVGDTSTFQLAHRVAAGAYEYDLRANGVTDPNDQNWYLRVREAAPPPAPTPQGDDPTPPRVLEPRPEIPTDTVIPPVALQYGYAMLGSIDDRGGFAADAGNGLGGVAGQGGIYDERIVSCRGLNPRDPMVRIDPNNRRNCIVRTLKQQEETRWAKSGWAHVIGAQGSVDRNNYWKHGPDYDYTFGGIKAGLDIFARQKADGTLDKAGIYIGYGKISSNVYGLAGASYGHKAGTLDMDAYSLGGYWTHRATQGWYTDAVIQGTWYTNTAAKSVLSETLSPDGFGILGSLEGGYEFKLGSGWTLTPQAQVVYQQVMFDDAHDSFGVYRFADAESLRARLGAKLARTWYTEDAARPRMMNAYLRANIWHEFLGNTETSVIGFHGENPLTTRTSLKGTWGEIGAGITAQVSDKVNVFANGNYQHSLDGKGMQGWDGRLGLTVRW